MITKMLGYSLITWCLYQSVCYAHSDPEPSNGEIGLALMVIGSTVFLSMKCWQIEDAIREIRR